MENELKEKISNLKKLLKKRNNNSFVFFEKLLIDIDNGNLKEVVETILKSYSIVQYGDFNGREETLLGEIWDMAEKLANPK